MTKWKDPYIGRWEDWTRWPLENGRANAWYEDTRKSLYVADVYNIIGEFPGTPHIGRADTRDKWTQKRMRKKKKKREKELGKTRKKERNRKTRKKTFYVANKENASEVGIRKAYKPGDSVNW